MPHVSRDAQGNIDGQSRRASDRAQEFIEDTDPEYLAYVSERDREETADETLQEQFTKNDFVRGLIEFLATKHNMSPQEVRQAIKTAAGL